MYKTYFFFQHRLEALVEEAEKARASFQNSPAAMISKQLKKWKDQARATESFIERNRKMMEAKRLRTCLQQLVSLKDLLLDRIRKLKKTYSL